MPMSIVVRLAPKRAETIGLLRRATNTSIREIAASIGTTTPVFELRYDEFDLEAEIARTRELVAELHKLGALLTIVSTASDGSAACEVSAEVMNNILDGWTDYQEYD